MPLDLTSRIRVVLLWTVVAVLAGAPRSAAAFDSDLFVICGSEFAIFDRFGPDGRILHVVPWTDEGELEVAGTVVMPGTQPHHWAIYGRYVVVRTWNDLYVYQVDDAFQPRLVHASQIDEARPISGGTTAIELSGSVVRAYGVERMVVLDLEACADECAPVVEAAVTPPSVPGAVSSCEIHKGGRIFALTRARTEGRGIVYHDLFLTRRRTDPRGLSIEVAFQPESILYLGTQAETVFGS